jgi:hypothetical protein
MKKLLFISLVFILISFYIFIQVSFVLEAGLPSDSFTIGFIPDTQYLASDGGGSPNDEAACGEIFKFFSDNKSALNVKFVSHLGDMTEDDQAFGRSREISRQKDPWKMLKGFYTKYFKANNIGFAPCRGNHDGQIKINETFSVSEISKDNPYYKGSINGIHNAYYTIPYGNNKELLVMVIEYIGPTSGKIKNPKEMSSEVLSWTKKVLSDNKDKLAIIATHTFNNTDVAGLIDNNKNVFMGIMGHSTKDTHEQYIKDGVTKHKFVFDYQGRDDHQEGAVIKYMTFMPSLGEVRVKTYSIAKKSYITDGTGSQLKFKLDMGYDNDNKNTAVATPKPVATSKPIATPKPVATSKPIATSKPVATPKPVEITPKAIEDRKISGEGKQIATQKPASNEPTTNPKATINPPIKPIKSVSPVIGKEDKTIENNVTLVESNFQTTTANNMNITSSPIGIIIEFFMNFIQAILNAFMRLFSMG